MNVPETNEKQRGFRILEQDFISLIIESQIKIGYAYTPLRLFYPLASLNHILKTEKNPEEMLSYLGEFRGYVEPRLGELHFDREGERFGITIPPEGMKYVHENVEASDFMKELILTTARHGCTMDQIEKVFGKYSDCVVRKDVHNGEFDVLMYFEDEIPDKDLYCFHKEGEHIIYHRYNREDYEDFGF